MVKLSIISYWQEMIKSQTEERISKLKQNLKQPTGKVLRNAEVKVCLSDLYSKYVLVPTDKAKNKIFYHTIVICKKYYIEALSEELGLDDCSAPTGNSTCTSCQIPSKNIISTHKTFMKSVGIELSDDDK